MAQTVIPWGDPKAVKHWSPKLHRDVNSQGYFARKFVGKGTNNIVQEKTELEKEAGDVIQFDLEARLKGPLVEGDAALDGKESILKHYSDTVTIDQARHAVSAGGRMSRQRTVHNIRQSCSVQLTNYWKQAMDELFFYYLSGDRGMGHSDIFPLGWTGRANNALRAPDAAHQLYGGDATSLATLVAADKMNRNLIERADVRAANITKQFPDSVNMYPLSVEGDDRWVVIMSPEQAFDLRNASTSAGDWFDIQKALATAQGANNPLVKGGLGMINNTILHSHRNVVTRTDGGAGSDVAVAEALLCGRQAGCIAYAASDGRRMSWVEDMKDYKNNPTVAAGYIFGISKSRFNGFDFGVIRMDTAAADPNA
jgi:N4-gp56 family major capsid protein